MTDTASAAREPTSRRVTAMLIHLGGIVALAVPSLIVYLTVEDRFSFLGRQARAALNFQLAVLGAMLVGFFTLWIAIGFYIVPAVFIANAVFSALASADALRGEPARYLVSLPIAR